MESNSEIIGEPSGTVPETARRYNPKWVGPIMTFFLPGSAHFLSGRRRTGVLLYLAFLLHVYLWLFSLGIPGVGFFYAAVGLFVIFILFFVALLISMATNTAVGMFRLAPLHRSSHVHKLHS